MKTNKKKIIIPVLIIILIVLLLIVLLKRCGTVDDSRKDDQISSQIPAVESAAAVEDDSIQSAESVSENAEISSVDAGESSSVEIELQDSDIASVEIGVSQDPDNYEPGPVESQESMAGKPGSGSSSGNSGGSSYNTGGKIGKTESQSSEAETAKPLPSVSDDDEVPRNPKQSEEETTAPESESESESETESEPGISDPVMKTKDEIEDYDDYEELSPENRAAIKKTFASLGDYNDWLTQLIRNRSNKIREGAIGYGSEAVAN